MLSPCGFALGGELRKLHLSRVFANRGMETDSALLGPWLALGGDPTRQVRGTHS
jgi:hypothetical protein